jgi:hypothetical protein
MILILPLDNRRKPAETQRNIEQQKVGILMARVQHKIKSIFYL